MAGRTNERDTGERWFAGAGLEGARGVTHSAAVVDESRQVATLGGVYNGVVVHPEQVAAADALLSVALLAVVRHHLVT